MTTPVPDEECEVWEIGCRTSDALAGVAGDALAALAKAVGDAVGSVLVDLSTVWVDVGTPNLTTSGNNPSDAVAFIQGSLWWYMAAAAVLSVTMGGARMAWERRAEPGLDVLRSLMTLTVVSGAGLAVIALAVQAADAFAVWIIDRSTVGTSFGENLGALLLAPLVTPTAVGDGMPALLVIFLGVGGIVTSCVQIVLMIVRSGMLVILAGIFPLSASFTTTETGRTWFRRCCAWLLAFILYKPAAAIVYATAFRLSGADLFGDDSSGGLLNVLVGVTMMVLAILALPALMRFVTPAISAMSAGASGAGLGLAAGALAVMPTGAAFARSGTSGSTGSGGPRGPQGAASSGGSGSGNSGSGGSGSGSSRKPSEPSGSGPSGRGARGVPPQGGGSAPSGGASRAGAGAAASGAGGAVAVGQIALQAAAAAQAAASRSTSNNSGEGPDGSR